MTAEPASSSPNLQVLREELIRREIESAELKSLKPSRAVYQKTGALLLRVTKAEAFENTKVKLEAVQKALKQAEEANAAAGGTRTASGGGREAGL